MGISDRLLGKTNVNGKPHIEAVFPAAALPGGEVRITGHGLRPQDLRRPRVRFGEIEGAVVISSDDFLVARVPAGRILRADRGFDQRTLQQSPPDQSRGPDCRESASGHQSRARRRGQHLRQFFREPRTKSSGRHLQDRHQLQRQALSRRPDECHFHRLRPRRADVRFVALRWNGVPRRSEWDHVFLRRGHGRRHRHRFRPRRKIFTSATAAARFSRSAPTARSSSSPLSSRAFPPTIWLSVRTEICS